MFSLQFTSCKNYWSKTPKVYEHNKDTIVKYYEWGSEQIVSLGIITIDSLAYNVMTIDRMIEVADGIRKRRFIVFSTLDNTYRYEINQQSFSFIGIEENKLIIGDSNCKEQIPLVGEELLCFDCLNNACLFLD
jgi:hypothetical protein